ncbi:hypothetical protein K3X13_07715 [Aliiroseovarius crassostreae]|uniref:Response regulatory domain-containing protein n=1 Tax=Aliiroseovarius crassostreae TaxID=154981 RepID=A0A9Q9H9K1_9RHOB|nr:hypothetical protein [Aliiroseovarius crassostreae]UWP87843.1 hypothetical protein K3J57_07765 [Aliiroseovarius crassostreae]UWP90996.1 hypothetical protein K3X13_07715 [Aliiroseovarius crassostreae]UWP94184.1 hypothetical protein K3X48_07890 [Aliiroseovarius crassostreae]UWP97308.1 hypothetical protein K3X53_07715 [Aliiroseovarius crassostreae]UWQ00463.1 hypothetical protein K3X44_07835 [Aliiroseovarius crassostreae]
MSSEAELSDGIEHVIETVPQFRVVRSNANALDKVDKSTRIDAVVLSGHELNSDMLELLNQVRFQFSGQPVIIVSDKLDEDQTRQLIKLQVHDWLTHPVKPESLIKSVETGIRGARIDTNRVHAVVSGSGGAGATTLAISLADLMVSHVIKKGESVALFDLDFATGNCGYSLDMVNSYQLDKIIATPQRIDAEFANLIQEKQRTGYHIYSFKRPELLTDANGYELVLRMLDAVNLQHEYTILDIPYYETEWRDDVLGAVNSCTLVTEANLPALKHTLDTLEKIKSLRDGEIPVQIVINKSKSRLFGSKLSAARLKELFGDVPCYFMPRDDDLIEEALDRGVLPSEISQRSRFLRGLKKYLTTSLTPSLEAQ